MPRWHDVGTDVAEGGQAAVLGEAGETAEPSARDVLEEDPFDGIRCAELEDLPEIRLDRVAHVGHRRTG